MLSFKAGLAIFFSAALAAVPAFATTSTTTHKPATHGHSSHKPTSKSKSHKLHGQQTIDSTRATEIQEALIREHYLTGAASGTWDTATQAAMQKYQSDQGWQTKLTPDSRALKKLGLGPDYSGAINAKGSTFGAPAPASSIPATQAAGFATAAGVNQ